MPFARCPKCSRSYEVVHEKDDCPLCPPDYDKMLDECLEALEKLDEWQVGFVRDLDRKQRKDGMLLNITPPQAKKLKEAYKDVCK